jgi:hypothetical protein
MEAFSGNVMPSILLGAEQNQYSIYSVRNITDIEQFCRVREFAPQNCYNVFYSSTFFFVCWGQKSRYCLEQEQHIFFWNKNIYCSLHTGVRFGPLNVLNFNDNFHFLISDFI